MSKFYCANIHNNLRISGSNITGTRLLPCCVYQTDKNYRTLDDYYSSEEIINLKTTEEWPSGCGSCKMQESLGQRSYRIDANNFWKDGSSGKRIEIFPSNVCNLKCMMCSEEFSTAFAQERNAIGESPVGCIKEFEIVSESLNVVSKIEDVESISLIGGEFFLAKGNSDILDFAIKHNIGLRVVTNATVISNKHLDKLKKIEDLHLQISIDGVDDSYEFMRYPATWKSFSTNTSRIITELPNANINFHFVVQPLNILHLIPTLDWVNKTKRPCRITNLIYPQHLSWAILKQDEKTLITDSINSQLNNFVITRQQKEFIFNLLKTIQETNYSFHDRHRFIELFTKLMTHRKIDARNHLGVINTLTKI